LARSPGISSNLQHLRRPVTLYGRSGFLRQSTSQRWIKVTAKKPNTEMQSKTAALVFGLMSNETIAAQLAKNGVFMASQTIIRAG
jgi:hypothetical protein